MTPGPTARALVIAVTGFTGERWPPLPFAPHAREAVSALRALGYRTVPHIRENLTSAELGALVRNEVRAGGPDDVLLVHVLTHGQVVNQSTLYALGSDARRDPDADVETWIRTVQNGEGHPRTLFLLDLCSAGLMSRLPWQAGIPRDRNRAWVVAACQPDEAAYDARLTRALTTVLGRLGQGELGIDPGRAHVPFPAFARELRQEVRRLTRHGYGQQVTATLEDPSDDGPTPPFFRNSAHAPGATTRSAPPDGLAFFAAQAAGHFTGRTRELRHLAPWIDRAGPGDLAVVTGGPGSGKSALLGVLVCAAHPKLQASTADLLTGAARLPMPVLDGIAAVAAAQRGLASFIGAIAGQLDLPPDLPPDELVERLLARARPPLLVVDGLDEADDGVGIMRRLLLPLVSTRRPDGAAAARVLVGCRAYEEYAPLLTRAAAGGDLIDLDTVPAEVLRADLATYVFRLLQREPRYQRYGDVQGAFADAVGRALTTASRGGGRQGEFLVAGLYTRHFVAAHARPVTDAKRARELGEQVPRTPAEVFELDIAGRPALRELLTVLATAREPGMPAGVLFRLTGDGRTRAELRALLREAHRYLRLSADARDGTTLYRLFHRSLADHLAASAPQGGLDAMLGILGPPAARDWEVAEPYVLDHAWAHAVAAGRREELLADPEYLLRLGPEALAAVLREAGDPALSAVFAEVPPYGTALPERRYALALAAARAGRTGLAARAARPPAARELPWQPLWAAGAAGAAETVESRSAPASSPVPPGDVELAKGKRHQEILTLACAVVDGRPTVVAAREDGRLQLWDLVSRQPAGPPLTGHDGAINAVATFTADGRALAVTAGSDGTVRVWDLAARTGVHVLRPGEEPFLRGVAATRLDGRHVVVVASGDGWLRGWDALGERPVGEEFGLRQSILTGVACLRAQGRTVAVTTDEDGHVCAFDLGTRELIDRRAYAHDGPAYAVACAGPPDAPLVVTTGDGGSIRVWRLGETLVPDGELAGHRDTVATVACATMRGRDVAVTGGVDGRLIAWDLAERRQIFEALPRRGWVRAVATAASGRPLAVTAATGGALAAWDLAAALPEAPATAPASTTAPRDAQVVRVEVLGEEGAVRLVYAGGGAATLDPRTGDPVDTAAPPRPAPVLSLHGRTLLPVASQDDPRVLWLQDAADGHELGRHETRITAVAVAGPGDGAGPLVFSGDAAGRVRVWDPDGRSLPGFTVPGEVSGLTAVDGELLLVNWRGEVIAFRHAPEPREAFR
ncbi:AAA family ATPase [Acrocarpospora catenulata]|uniref:AAA family ATPase n=1 Tax=Acrocarpospora catenulata TaxID=2836182 RepID=UPI001BDA9714|nr:AAA family ATPase [Acrocarpospora catenulata]